MATSVLDIKPPEKSDDLKVVQTKPWLYNLLLASGLAIGIVLLLIGALTWNVMLWNSDSIGFNLGGPFVLVTLILAATIFKVVAEDEKAVIYFYGIALKNVSSGPHIILRPLMRLVKFPTDIQEIEEPGPRDKIFWGDEDVEMPKGMVRPIFVTSRSQITGETRALDTQLQYAVAFYVFWSVSDDVATFRRNSRSIAEADSQIKKISLTLLDQIVGALTAEGVIADQANVNDRFDDAICRKAYGMGVEIHQAGLHGFNLSHDMARAMRDRGKAQFELETTNMQTAGQARRIREIGQAEGDADYARARGSIEGRADGMAVLQDNLGTSGDAVLAFEALREILPKSTVLAGASAGASDLAGLVGTMAATFAAMKGSDQASKPPTEEKK